MFEWIFKCFGKNNNTKNKRTSEKELLRNLKCKVCNKNTALYYSNYENGRTHCRNCKKDGMKIYIYKNNLN